MHFLAWIILFISGISDCGAVIRQASDLSCDFQGGWCNWRNESRGVGGNSWNIEDRVVSGIFNSIPRGVLGLGDTFAFVDGRRQAEEVLLVSDVITCQDSGAHLGFFIWKASLGSSLEVCHRSPPGPNGTVECFAKFSGYIGLEWIAVYVVVPAVNRPFEVVFRANVRFYIDVIAIDKIIYGSDHICDPVFSSLFQASTVPPVPTYDNLLKEFDGFKDDSFLQVTPPPLYLEMKPIRRVAEPEPIRRDSSIEHPDQGLELPPLGEIAVATKSKQRERKSLAVACIALICDFELGLCDYETDEAIDDVGKLRILCSQINIGFTSILPRQGQCFLMSTSTQNFRVRKVLASRPVFTHSNSELVFDYYLPVDATSRLQVCINSILNCIWSATRPKRSLQRWWKQRIQLQPGKLQIFFVLEHIARGSFAALDNVRIVVMNNSERTALCEMYADDGKTLFVPPSLARATPAPFFSNLDEHDAHIDSLVAEQQQPQHNYNDYHSTSDVFNFDIDFG